MHHAAPGMTIAAIIVVAVTHDPASTHAQGFAMTVLSGVALETPVDNVFIGRGAAVLQGGQAIGSESPCNPLNHSTRELAVEGVGTQPIGTAVC